MKIYKIIILSFLFSALSYANLREEFPSYSYVLTEFNVDESYIDNPEFKEFVNKHKHTYRKRFIRAVRRGNLLIPTIKEMMYQRDISPVFLYISMIESAFNPKARSRTGAGGLWQITVNTGRELRLKQNSIIDERYDPIRSTNAAIKYLYKINNNLNSWYLTTMAYNCGNGCVNKSIKKAGTRDLATLISSKNSYIKEETKKYIKKILLMAMIGENYLFKENDNIGQLMYQMNDDRITPVLVRAGENLSNLASILNMNTSYLKKINAHLRNEHTPYNHSYMINIPHSKINIFNEHYHKRVYTTRNNRI